MTDITKKAKNISTSVNIQKQHVVVLYIHKVEINKKRKSERRAIK